MFDRRGYFTLGKEALGEEELMELALELGIEDFSLEEDSYELFTSMDDYLRVREELESLDLELESLGLETKELAMIPQTYVAVDDDKAPQVLRLMEALEDQDDTQNVWANFDIDESALVAHSD
jgi:transcriptional/translational regulatory protein YebC/TACO1